MKAPLLFSDVYKRGAPATTDRRDALLTWIRERPTHHGLTARQIAVVSGVYEGNGRQEKCSTDCNALANAGFLLGDGGRPERWWPRWRDLPAAGGS